MRKKIKLFFYIFSALTLGVFTIVEILVARNALVASNGKEPEAALQQVKAVIGKWRERKPFEFGDGLVPATPSATEKTLPTPEPTENQASPSAEL